MSKRDKQENLFEAAITKLVESMIEDQFEDAFIKVTDSPEKKVEKILSELLGRKVNYNGLVDSYEENNKQSYLTYLARPILERLIKEELFKYIEEHNEKFRQMIKDQLESVLESFVGIVNKEVQKVMERNFKFMNY